jgi:hypothetical protein
MLCWVRYTNFVLDVVTELRCAFAHRKIECKVYPRDTVGAVSSSVIRLCVYLNVPNSGQGALTGSGVGKRGMHNVLALHVFKSQQSSGARDNLTGQEPAVLQTRKNAFRSAKTLARLTTYHAPYSQNSHQHYCSYVWQVHSVSDIEQFVRMRKSSIIILSVRGKSIQLKHIVSKLV